MQGGPRLVAHCLQWGPRRDTCTEHTMNRCEPCAISRSELVQPRGLRLGFYQRKPPRAAPVKSYPQLKGWAPGREMGLRLHNRARYMLHGQSDDVLDRHVIQKIREQRRRSNTGVTVGDLRSGFHDKPPTEAHLSDFCFNTKRCKVNLEGTLVGHESTPPGGQCCAGGHSGTTFYTLSLRPNVNAKYSF